jgi:hypothetical protein
LLVPPVDVLPVPVIMNSRGCIKAWPAAGPDTRMKVLEVMRRASGEFFTTTHLSA